MGWGSPSRIFNDKAVALVNDGAPYKVITKTLAKMIASLLYSPYGWDTVEESLADYAKIPAVVEAFRQNGIYLVKCDHLVWWLSSGETCEKQPGHEDDHQYPGQTWPNEK